MAQSSTQKSKTKRNCMLVCLQKKHEDIPLPDGVSVMIGRSIETKITDPRCSRHQVELTAECSRRKVKVKQIGHNMSSVNGSDIGKDEETTMGTDSTLFVLSGQYPHKICFKSESSNKEEGLKQLEDNCNSTKDQNKNQDKVKAERKKDLENNNADSPASASNTNDSKKKTDLKRSNVEDQSEEPNKKKKKPNDEGRHRSKDKESPKTENEDKHVKSVSDKLEQLRKMNKDQGKSPSSNNKELKDKDRRSLTDKVKDHSKNSPKSSSPAPESKWMSHEQLEVFISKGVVHQRKIAGFDIDGTIIITKSGRTFPTGPDDWQIIYPDVFGKLKSLHKDGYKIVFFTNQLGVAKGKTNLDHLKTKFENVIQKLQIPVQVFIATHEGKNRKPNDGMWKKLQQRHNGGIDIDISSSLYVGDAAGRPKDWAPKKKKDFSLSDRLFALNLGLKFYTPEEYFLGQKKAPFTMPAFDPRELKSDAEFIPAGCSLVSKGKELIVLVGYPASGKSHFASHILKPQGYEVVNRDTLGSWQKCVKRAQEALGHGRVVVDNTNVSKDERERYLSVAKSAGVPCRCFLFSTSIEHCRHNERFRQLMDASHTKINEMIFNSIKSKYQEPSKDEGFSEVVKVNFVPTFSSASIEAEYRKFLSEK